MSAQSIGEDLRLSPAGNTGKWFLLNVNGDVVAEFPPTTSEDERELVCNSANFHEQLIDHLTNALRYVVLTAENDFENNPTRRMAAKERDAIKILLRSVRQGRKEAA